VDVSLSAWPNHDDGSEPQAASTMHRSLPGIHLSIVKVVRRITLTNYPRQKWMVIKTFPEMEGLFLLFLFTTL
jgi:hypothetical protein